MEIIVSMLSSGVSAILPFIILLGLLVFVHELGHFLVAIACGVHVEVFSLGFGKKLLKFTRNGTEYCLSLIPLGGYVKMYGDDVTADIPEDRKAQSFTHKSVFQRIAIVLAGPLMNFFFAILVFGVVAMMGEDARAPRVGDVAAASAAGKAGIRSGDQILSADGQPTASWEQVQTALNKRIGLPITLEVTATGEASPRKVELIPQAKANPNILSLDTSIGEVEGLAGNSLAPVIGVRAGGAADKLGFRTGDRIVSVGGTTLTYFRELPAAWDQSEEKKVFKIERPASPDALTNAKASEADKYSTLEIEATPKQLGAFAAAGIESSELYLLSIVKGSPAEKAGLASGDRIEKISGEPISSWDEVVARIKSFNGKDPVSVDVVRAGETKNFAITPEMTTQTTLFGSEEKRFTIGIIPWVQGAPLELVKIKSDNAGAALTRGFKRTVDASIMTVVSFVRLIQGMISPKHIGGVISIGQAAHETYKNGMTQFLQMMAVISVHLFVLNLLPVPVLDGGHLVFYTIELIKGAPLSMRKLEIAQQVGLVLLMSLMAFALFNDFSRVFGFS